MAHLVVTQEQFKPTKTKKAIKDIAQQIEALADLLATQGVAHAPEVEGEDYDPLQGTAQFAIEAEHDQESDAETGLDGYPAQLMNCRTSYKATVSLLLDLARSARTAAARYPAPRTKSALPMAALGLLHIRFAYDFPPPLLSLVSDDLKELERITAQAGIHLSPSALKGALFQAKKKFDDQFSPPYVSAILSGV